MRKLIPLILFTLITSLQAQTIPDGGQEMLGPYPLNSFIFEHNGEGAYELIENNDYGKVARLTTEELPDNPWDLQIGSRIKRYAREGDVMLLVFKARMISSKDETGQAMGRAVFERAGPPWDKSIERNFTASGEWKQYYLPFNVLKSDFAPGEARINFLFGLNRQVMEITDIQLYNYKNTIAKDSLPKTEYTYPGRDIDASWRTKAAKMIDENRKASIDFVLQGKKGKSTEGYTVGITMKKHAFGFGTAIDASTFNSSQPYKENFYKHFNKAVFENDLKWHMWELPQIRTQVNTAMYELKNKNISIRGHVLVWPSWRNLPYDLKEHADDPKKLQNKVLFHITDEVTKTDGYIAEWDVMNEPFDNHDLMDICGKDVMIEWYKKTKELDPDPVLYINDYNIIGGGGLNKAHQDHYFETIKYLQDKGAPLEGIGFQSHFAWTLTPPENVWKILDRYSVFGLEMQVTEFDVSIDDEQLQADYTRDFLTAIFAYPKMTGFMMWGFWEGRHWRAEAAMLRRDFTEKPMAKVWHDLIYNQWWTKEKLTADAEGKTTTRGFMGEYEYFVTDKDGKVVDSGEFTLGKDGIKMELKVK